MAEGGEGGEKGKKKGRKGKKEEEEHQVTGRAPAPSKCPKLSQNCAGSGERGRKNPGEPQK